MSKTSTTNRLPADTDIPGNGSDHHEPKLKDGFIKNIKGNDFVLYDGLLDLAHQHGLIKLEVEHIQLPAEENDNTAVCRAVATTKDGAVFSDIADANVKNVNRMITLHIIRMASTRAKARALRDLCNIGITCLEELAEEEDVIGGNGSAAKNSRSSNKKTASEDSRGNSAGVSESPRSRNTADNGSESSVKDCNDAQKEPGTPKMSIAQKRAISNLAKRRGLSDEEVNQIAQDSFESTVEELCTRDAAALIRTLQQSA